MIIDSITPKEVNTESELDPTIDPVVFFNNAQLYGILSKEDADTQLMMNIEKRIQKEFMGISGVDLKITHHESNGMYRIRVPKGIREEYGLEKAQYYSKERIKVLKDLYYDMFGCNGRSYTLAEVCQMWLDEREKDPDVSTTTKRHDRNYFDEYIFNDQIGSKLIGTITVSEWDEFFKKITKGRQMLRKSFTNVKSFLNMTNDYAVRMGYARHNNCREISPNAYKFKVSSKKAKIYTKEEVVAIYNRLKDSDNIYDLCLALHLCFPCRIGEIKALCRRDIDLDKRKLSICKEVISYDYEQILVDHTKSGLEEGNRDIYIPDAAMPVLKKILDRSEREELFLGKTGKWLLTPEINNHLKDVCEELGIEYLSTHKFRAWYATEAAKLGMDEVTMTRTFGWKDRDTAKEYIRAARTETAQKEATERIIDF